MACCVAGHNSARASRERGVSPWTAAWLKILELRAKAQQIPGGKFSLKEFHNVVLQTGNVPLAVLEQVIDGSVATVR